MEKQNDISKASGYSHSRAAAGSDSVEVVPEVVSQMADAMTKRHVMICGGRNMGKTWARRIAMAQDAKPVNSLPQNSEH